MLANGMGLSGLVLGAGWSGSAFGAVLSGSAFGTGSFATGFSAGSELPSGGEGVVERGAGGTGSPALGVPLRSSPGRSALGGRFTTTLVPFFVITMTSTRTVARNMVAAPAAPAHTTGRFHQSVRAGFALP